MTKKAQYKIEQAVMKLRASVTRTWVRANWGVSARIADQLGFSRVTVSDVLHGRRNNKSVAKALRKAGWPGWR